MDPQGNIVPDPSKPNSGLTIDEFRKLRIPNEAMRDGILFIWVEKELILEIIDFLGEQKFEYIENLCYVMLDPE